MQQSNQFFATARPLRLFLMVALPGLVSMLAASIYNICEGSFVGRLIGEGAFAAVNIAMPVVMINFALADLIGVGSSVHISVALGRKDSQRANNFFTCSVLLIFLTGFIMGALMFLLAPAFTKFMGAEGELAEMAIKYVRVYALFSPITTIVFATDNYLRISGFVKGSMFLNLFMTFLTVSFLVLFLGILDMDVSGSALSSCLAMLTCAIIALIPFVFKRAVLRFVRPKITFKMIREIFVCGLPIFLNNIAGRVSAILMNSALLRHGGQTGVAAYAVLMYSSGVVEPMLYGMSDSVQPAIGYNWGAKSLDRVKGITKVMLAACGILSIGCTAVMYFFPNIFAAVFIDPNDTALMEMSISAMRIFAFSFILGWFSFAIQGFFGAIEKPLPATIISICRAMVFPVILIFALEPWGLDGLWFNYVGTSILGAILAVVLLVFSQRTMHRDIERQASIEDFD